MGYAKLESRAFGSSLRKKYLDRGGGEGRQRCAKAFSRRPGDGPMRIWQNAKLRHFDQNQSKPTCTCKLAIWKDRTCAVNSTFSGGSADAKRQGLESAIPIATEGLVIIIIIIIKTSKMRLAILRR